MTPDLGLCIEHGQKCVHSSIKMPSTNSWDSVPGQIQNCGLGLDFLVPDLNQILTFLKYFIKQRPITTCL